MGGTPPHTHLEAGGRVRVDLDVDVVLHVKRHADYALHGGRGRLLHRHRRGDVRGEVASVLGLLRYSVREHLGPHLGKPRKRPRLRVPLHVDATLHVRRILDRAAAPLHPVSVGHCR